MSFVNRSVFSRHTRLLGAISFTAFVYALPAAAIDFTISNTNIPQVDKKPAVMVQTIEVKGSNLTQEEFLKMLNPQTPKEESVALALRLQVDLVNVPEVVISKTGEDAGSFSMRGYQLVKYNQGKFQRFALGGVDGKFAQKDNGGDVSIKAGPLVVEDADITKYLQASVKGDIADASGKIGKLDFRDFEVIFPEKTPAGPLMHTIRLGALQAVTAYAGDLPTKSFAEARNIIFIPAPKSGAAEGLAMFGYDKLDLGLRGEGTYNPATKGYDLSDVSVRGINAGVLSLKGLFGNIGPDAFNGAQLARIGALMAGDVSNVSLRYADNGLFEKALVFYAKSVNKEPAAVRQEWAGMVAGVLPMLAGGDMGVMKVAGAVSEFIKAPKSLTISIKAKNGTVRFSELQQIKDPTEVLKLIDVDAQANK